MSARSALATAPWRAWLARRLPRAAAVRLDRRTLFVLPTPLGLAFLGMAGLLWLLGANYQNGVVHAMAALTAALWLASVFHTFANLAGLEVRVARMGAAFPGEPLAVVVELSRGDSRPRRAIRLAFPGGEGVRVDLAEGQPLACATLAVAARRRGIRRPDRLAVATTAPFGLVRVWSQVLLAGEGLVYPRPAAVPPRHREGRGEGSAGAGDEAFAGLAPYRPGDDARRIAWKAWARGAGLHVQRFAADPVQPTWVDWEDHPGLPREARLERLCGEVLARLEGEGAVGLRLPGIEVPPGVGPAQRARLLAALARFEAPEDEGDG
ncbi:MAG: hypothetical protein KatS3mg124_0025 [Porticoccaceae bacterium]|nr:MAG: hypothetical protein KatS3mg124_0025 [Porticoccaceae bacterium]